MVDHRYVRRRENKEQTEKTTLLTVKPGGGPVMLQGCFASSGTGNLKHEEGKMDVIKHQEILGEIMSVRRLKL